MDVDAGRLPKAHTHRVTEIFRSPHFAFVAEDLTLPNGRRVEMAMVRHPGSVGVVPLVDDRHVLMEHQYRPCVREALARLQWISEAHLKTMSISRCRDSEMYLSR
jgi:hypothetical protein